MEVLRVITPLDSCDCFSVINRGGESLDFPLHAHKEMELHIMFDGEGATRIVGDHSGEVGAAEMVLIGWGVVHGWTSGKTDAGKVSRVTVQFLSDMLSSDLLSRNLMADIRDLFQRADRGVLFPPEMAGETAARVKSLCEGKGFASLLEFLDILKDLAVAQGAQTLSSVCGRVPSSTVTERIHGVMDYMKSHYGEHISLADVAGMSGMSEVAFSRFIKKHTGFTFIETLNQIRLNYVARRLTETDEPIADIARGCGFNNMANFNRMFKGVRQMTPREFRQAGSGAMYFI